MLNKPNITKKQIQVNIAIPKRRKEEEKKERSADRNTAYRNLNSPKTKSRMNSKLSPCRLHGIHHDL